MVGHALVTGIPFGCIYALVGLGLVLTYRAAGVFNFAFGAQAYLSAAVFYVTVHSQHWPVWAAALVSVGGAGVASGLVLDRALFRRLRTAPLLVKLVVNLGLLVAIPAVVQAAGFGAGAKLAPPDLGPTPARLLSGLGLTVDTNQLAVVAATAATAAGLGLLLRASAVGLRLRAVVESPRLAQLAGVDADRMSALAWIVSSVVAGLAGVLLAPLYGRVDALSFDTLVVAAVAAAAFGGLASLSLTVVGGLVLGVGQELLATYLPLGSQVAQGLRPSLPFILLLGVLLVLPGLGRRRVEDPLAGVGPPAEGIGPVGVPRAAPRALALAGGGAVAVAVLAALLPQYWLFIATQAVAMGVVFCSFTVLTGMSGQLSLCQAGFAGVGAFTAGQLANHLNLSILAGLLAGGALAALVGLVAAVPALRVGGLYLALATFAFGLLLDNIVFPEVWAGNGTSGITVLRPLVGPVSFSATRPFFLLAVAVLATVAVGVGLLRRSTAGQYLAAVRGSELGAASIGIDPRRVKVLAFAVSAGIAGVGGGLLGSTLGAVSASNFTFLQSLLWLVVVAITGVRTVGGAVGAGVALIVLPRLLGLLPGDLTVLASVVFGLGALSYLRHPEGLVAWWGRALARPAQEAAAGAGRGAGPAREAAP